MESETSLLLDVTVAFGLALVGGWIATRLKLPAIVGYIAAGAVISPLTPGFVGDTERLRLLGDIGVVLLLFAIGVQFTVTDLAKGGVRIIVVAVVATAAGFGAGFVLAPILGWSLHEATFAGAAAGICSSVVLVTFLERRGEIATEHGRAAIGFAIVQDLIAVVLIIVLDVISDDSGGSTSEVFRETGWAALKAFAFVVGVLLFGLRIVPLVLNRVADERSRELFFLAIALLVIGTALASEQVGLSIALGAFLAGILVSESDLSHRVLGELLPIRDVFAVLFFVAVGMLIDPDVLKDEWASVIAISSIILVARPFATFAVMRLTGFPVHTTLMTAALTVPIAEFSFLLAGTGLDNGAISGDFFSAIITAAVISIVLTPGLLAAAERLTELRPRPTPEVAGVPPSRLGRRAVVCGYNEVGRTIVAILQPRFDVRVIEDDARAARDARSHDIDVIEGNPTSPAVLEKAGIEDARVVVIALEDPFATRLFAERARELNPHVDIVARALVQTEAAKLRARNIETVVAEDEVAFELARYGLHRFGLSTRESLAIIQQFRARARLPE